MYIEEIIANLFMFHKILFYVRLDQVIHYPLDTKRSWHIAVVWPCDDQRWEADKFKFHAAEQVGCWGQWLGEINCALYTVRCRNNIIHSEHCTVQIEVQESFVSWDNKVSGDSIKLTPSLFTTTATTPLILL